VPAQEGGILFGYKLEWVPSQKGMVFECLQAHHAMIFDSVMATSFGSKPVPLWEPSQNG
jgi:hypothetical protein